ncbi:hypothetical protein ABT87_11820 [Salmonella enterica subsp. enterica serovar Typhimurium]|nr:hypothetical protein ABT87_11820 [Salmonella enterica subsp. enterica serovar Typhimurium]
MTKRQRTFRLDAHSGRIGICSAALLLVAGCASKGDVQCPPGPKPPVPAAWAMLPPSNSLQVLDVLNIRAGIISDQEKLKYLQEYVRTQCE